MLTYFDGLTIKASLNSSRFSLRKRANALFMVKQLGISVRSRIDRSEIYL